MKSHTLVHISGAEAAQDPWNQHHRGAVMDVTHLHPGKEIWKKKKRGLHFSFLFEGT